MAKFGSFWVFVFALELQLKPLRKFPDKSNECGEKPKNWIRDQRRNCSISIQCTSIVSVRQLHIDVARTVACCIAFRVSVNCAMCAAAAAASLWISHTNFRFAAVDMVFENFINCFNFDSSRTQTFPISFVFLSLFRSLFASSTRVHSHSSRIASAEVAHRFDRETFSGQSFRRSFPFFFYYYSFCCYSRVRGPGADTKVKEQLCIDSIAIDGGSEWEKIVFHLFFSFIFWRVIIFPLLPMKTLLVAQHHHRHHLQRLSRPTGGEFAQRITGNRALWKSEREVWFLLSPKYGSISSPYHHPPPFGSVLRKKFFPKINLSKWNVVSVVQRLSLCATIPHLRENKKNSRCDEELTSMFYWLDLYDVRWDWEMLRCSHCLLSLHSTEQKLPFLRWQFIIWSQPHLFWIAVVPAYNGMCHLASIWHAMPMPNAHCQRRHQTMRGTSNALLRKCFQLIWMKCGIVRFPRWRWHFEIIVQTPYRPRHCLLKRIPKSYQTNFKVVSVNFNGIFIKCSTLPLRRCCKIDNI